MNSLNLAQI